VVPAHRVRYEPGKVPAVAPSHASPRLFSVGSGSTRPGAFCEPTHAFLLSAFNSGKRGCQGFFGILAVSGKSALLPYSSKQSKYRCGIETI